MNYLIKRKFNYKSNLAYYEIAEFMIKYINPNSIIVCIGTDKCVGDCLGPLVGTFLEEHNFPLPVYGTLKDPIHALNLDKKLEEINKLHPNACIIGIDACLGDTNSIGEIHTRDAAEFFTSRSIRLHLVFEMAKVISNGLINAYYLNSLSNKQC